MKVYVIFIRTQLKEFKKCFWFFWIILRSNYGSEVAIRYALKNTEDNDSLYESK